MSAVEVWQEAVRGGFSGGHAGLTGLERVRALMAPHAIQPPRSTTSGWPAPAAEVESERDGHRALGATPTGTNVTRPTLFLKVASEPPETSWERGR